jgi:hypothetical protein
MDTFCLPVSIVIEIGHMTVIVIDGLTYINFDLFQSNMVVLFVRYPPYFCNKPL